MTPHAITGVAGRGRIAGVTLDVRALHVTCTVVTSQVMDTAGE